jgi:hypothetical protein
MVKRRSMRLLRLLPLLLTVSIPVLAQTTPQVHRDPQAVAAVETAITALGGATAIGLVQSWAFQAQMQGPIDNGTATETISLQIPNVGGSAVRHQFAHSPFVPVLLAPVLLKMSQDQSQSIQYAGTVSLGAQNATVVVVLDGNSVLQRWFFDTRGLPARVEIHAPIEVGQFQSFSGTVDFSDYRSSSGVQYPFRVVEQIASKPFTQTIALQSVRAN